MFEDDEEGELIFVGPGVYSSHTRLAMTSYIILSLLLSDASRDR